MNRKELIKELKERINNQREIRKELGQEDSVRRIFEYDIEDFLDAFVALVYENLDNDVDILISNLGKFTIKSHKARIMSHPRTQEKLEVPSRKRVNFEVSRSLKQFVNGDKDR